MQYIIYCDESVKNGEYYSNFYGGALIRSIHLEEVKTVLKNKVSELNINGEVKWQKVTANYLEKYKSLVDTVFKFILIQQKTPTSIGGEMNATIALIQRVFKHPLNKDKSPGGCHGFCRGFFRASSKKSGHIVELCESEATATITPRRN